MMSSFNPLPFTVAYHTLHTHGLSLNQSCAVAAFSPHQVCASNLLNGLLSAGQNGLPPTPDILHFGCSYHLHPSHCFLSIWGAVRLEENNWQHTVMQAATEEKNGNVLQCKNTI